MTESIPPRTTQPIPCAHCGHLIPVASDREENLNDLALTGWAPSSQPDRLPPSHSRVIFDAEHEAPSGAGPASTQQVRYDAGYSVAFNRRGCTMVNRGLYEESLKEFSEAIRLNPDFAGAFNNRGYALPALQD